MHKHALCIHLSDYLHQIGIIIMIHVGYQHTVIIMSFAIIILCYEKGTVSVGKMVHVRSMKLNQFLS